MKPSGRWKRAWKSGRFEELPQRPRECLDSSDSAEERCFALACLREAVESGKRRYGVEELLEVLAECSAREKPRLLLTILAALDSSGRPPSERSFSELLAIDADSESCSYAHAALMIRAVQLVERGNENFDRIVEARLERFSLAKDERLGALSLAWLVRLARSRDANEETFSRKCGPLGARVARSGAFRYLYDAIRHPAFSKGTASGTVFRSSAYELVCSLCDEFDGDGSIATHPYAAELCGELLADAAAADAFWKASARSERRGLASVWDAALEFFPYDSKTLSSLAAGLATASPTSLAKLMDELSDLPMFTVAYEPRAVSLRGVDDEENAIVAERYHPYDDRTLFVEAGSRAAVLDRRNATLIHFRTGFAYWDAVRAQIRHFVDNAHRTSFDVEKQLDELVWSVSALNSVLEKSVDPPTNLTSACEAVFELLVKFSHSNAPRSRLISESFRLCAALIPKFGGEIFSRLSHVRLLPRIDDLRSTEERYANGASFSSSFVGHFLANVEQTTGKYDVLLSYLDVISAFFKCDYSDEMAFGILLPGLVFILREVFPHASTWNFERPEEKHRLHYKCLSYILKVLNLSPDVTTNAADRVLNGTCIYSLVNLVDGNALLNFVAFGEERIQKAMEEETDWTNGPAVEQIKMVQMAMSALMQCLRLKHLLRDKSALTPIELSIYAQPRQKDTINVIPVVTRYMNHVFNRNLPNTACSLLRRFALESHTSLLVCLDLPPHRIRTMFLERLRDDSESDLFKTTILDFVAACVEKQPGLTEVFFKTFGSRSDANKIFDKEPDSQSTDGILTYMAEYLSAVKDNPNGLYNPLLSRIMNLFHALWKNNMQTLVDDLKSNSNFWEYLCNPLFGDVLPGVKAYAQIFNMMGIELFLSEGKVNGGLRSALEKFFDHANGHLKAWIEYIFRFKDKGTEPEETLDGDVPTWLALLASWKNFISIFIKYEPVPIDLNAKYAMSRVCLEALNGELKKASDNRPIIMLAELYAVYFSNWKLDCLDDWQEFFERIAELHTNTSLSFTSLHERAKYSVLAICTLSLNLLAYDMKPEKDSSRRIFHSVCLINNIQLDRPRTNDEESAKSVSMAFKLLEQAVYAFGSYFRDSKSHTATDLINKLVISVAETVHKAERLDETVAALNCLAAFAKTEASESIVCCNVGQNLWLKFLPPADLAHQNNGGGWRPEGWWRAYGSGVDLVTALLQSRGCYFSSEAIMFAGIQEEYLIESILLAGQTLDAGALNLSHAALLFLTELVKYHGRWKREHNRSLTNLVRAVSVCLHYCITLILRPRSICLFIETPQPSALNLEESENASPSPKVVAVLNKLLELVHLSAVVLRCVSPNLLSLLADPFIEFSHWQPLMELQFGSPKLSGDPHPPLTFGTVVSGVCLLARSLNYNYHAEDVPLNAVARQCGRKMALRRRISGGGQEEGGVRRRSFRSDSVTSVSSTTSTTVINSNWLAALDKRLVLLALENVLTVLASQSLLAVKDPKMASKDKRVVRRELCAELPVFHDFVKKKIAEASSHPKSHLTRRKYGIFPLLDDDAKEGSEEESGEADDAAGSATPPAPAPRKRATDSMRVSVVRKLYLDKATKHPCPDKDRDAHASPKSSLKSGKHVTWDECSLSSQDESSADRPHHCILSEVQMVEEDYLHFLSNVFLYICQTDN